MSVFQKKPKGRSFNFGRNPVPNQTGIRGRVLAIGEPMHQKNFTTKELEYWDKEETRKKEMVSVTLQTELRDQPGDDGQDDGVRALFLTVDYKPGGKLAAVQDALEAAGADDLAVGGELALWFTGFDPKSQNPDNPRKLYQATWTPPPAAGGAFQPGQQQQQQQQPPAQQTYQQPPVQQQPPAQQQQGWNPPGPQQVVNQGPAQQIQPQQQAWNPPAAQQQGLPYDQGTGEITQQGWAPPPANPAPVPAPAPVPSGDTGQVQALVAAGASDGDIFAATGAPQDVIQAVRNLARLQG